jgi:hypothetical protein
MIDLWGLRWVECANGLDCLDLSDLNARLIHLDGWKDWQFTLRGLPATVGPTPEAALEASFGPPIQVLGVTYYPLPQAGDTKQYLPESRGQSIDLELHVLEQEWRVPSYWTTAPNPEQAILDYLNYREVGLQEDLARTLQEIQDWRKATIAFRTQP